MPPPSASSALLGRRLLAALLGGLSLVAAGATLTTPPARAADPGPPTIQASATASPPFAFFASPSPSPTPSPTCDLFGDQANCTLPSPSPSPSVIVVSPVPDPPSPPPTTPSYLVGAEPPPSPKTGESVSSPVPLGGGFVDQLPSPSEAVNVPTGTLSPHQSSLPLPFLAVGALLILGAIGSLIYAVAPRDKKVFSGPKRPVSSPVTFTPYGPDAPGTNILSSHNPDPGPPKRR
ncbi:MAG: hypothetical protein NVSMB17_11860 [Candidatus Dormibacteria bacterium]